MKEILLVTKGHPFEREPFFALFDGMEGVNWTHVEQPAAQALFNVEQAMSRLRLSPQSDASHQRRGGASDHRRCAGLLLHDR